MQKPVVPTVNYEKPTTALSIETGDDFIDDIIKNRNRHLNNQANDIKNTLDTVNGLTTIGSAYEAIVGESASGRPLSSGERAVSVFSAIATPLGVMGKAGKAGAVLSKADDVVKTNKHHAIPMFLGGADHKLNIIRIPEGVHKAFHSALEQSLKAKFGLPARGTKGSTKAWGIHFAGHPGDQKEAMIIVLNVSLQHGTDIFNQALKTLKTPGMVKWY